MSSGSPYGWRIGSLGGTPVYIGRSWPVIVALIVVMFGPILGSPVRSASYGYWVAAGYAILLFVSVLVHEAAHAFAARSRGRSVSRIVIDVWGGHTVYDTRGSSALTEAFVAISGPLANLALAGLGWLALPYVTGETASVLLEITTRANLLVAIFNLLPGLPLDGGHVVSSLVWRFTGSRGKGLVAAGWLGRAVAVGALLWFVGRPLLAGRTPDLIWLLWVGMICVFLWRGASSAIAGGRVLDVTTVDAFEVLEDVAPVAATDTVATARRSAEASPTTALVVVDEGHRPIGLVDLAALAAVPADAAGHTRVSAITLRQPDTWTFALPTEAELTDVVRAMAERQLSVGLAVEQSSGRVLGLVRAERVNEFIGKALGER